MRHLVISITVLAAAVAMAASTGHFFEGDAPPLGAALAQAEEGPAIP